VNVSQETSRPPSPAQLEVLAQYVEGGLTIDEVARLRGVTSSTVEQQLAACRRRLDAVTTAQAYVIAAALGVLRLPEMGNTAGGKTQSRR
jgi:DNA-binding CsgD family transcriptional regulator